jgi:hypothetical protein
MEEINSPITIESTNIDYILCYYTSTFNEMSIFDSLYVYNKGPEKFSDNNVCGVIYNRKVYTEDDILNIFAMYEEKKKALDANPEAYHADNEDSEMDTDDNTQDNTQDNTYDHTKSIVSIMKNEIDSLGNSNYAILELFKSRRIHYDNYLILDSHVIYNHMLEDLVGQLPYNLDSIELFDISYDDTFIRVSVPDIHYD